MKFFLCFFFLFSLNAEQRPNFIFLLADDRRADAMSCAGDPIIKTPHLDSLAADGQRFSHAYTAAPICKPSRVCFFLGQHQRTHGVGFATSKKMDEQQWSNSYPELLRNAGYYTGFIGKFGVDSYTFKGQADEKFDFWRAHDGWSKFFPKQRENTQVYKKYQSDIITEIMGECISEFFDSRDQDKPFCLSVSFSAPHASTSTSMVQDGGWFMDKAANNNPKLKGHAIYDKMYRDVKWLKAAIKNAEAAQHIPLNVMNSEHGRKKVYAYSYRQESFEEYNIRYAQLISGVDHQVGLLRQRLQKEGLNKNTIIIYSSDNGLLRGDYGMGGKGLIYDATAKIPFIVYNPLLPESRAGIVNESLLISIDLAATLLDYAGVAKPKSIQGESFKGILEGQSTGREQVLLESLFTLRGNPMAEGLRKGRWKYVRFFRMEAHTELLQETRERYDFRYDMKAIDFASPAIYEQLFDVEKDPSEVKNLATNPEYQSVLQEMRKLNKEESTQLSHE
ncbi:mucin-desulfating sulfatase (N-acetylglucosamine-6-sulfatase) [Lentisphaera araneosa HTCC2155]|uniref:Mucin-desulfating sulfatase (N-acetylglucosamine-6-sulfatase) n=1 Tax=Lentisphaera araneosa HTCC2155 TaxID=313628 RepID=A6DKM5_9BACT|nr:sulfatase-like hydrolase/transferase [Lentisphaera araneosa]EDM27923.1 mucin-desulfating sulfatase (N-acetylglucosamine-6-sulfatase) [Lentisphaera araneosa HTCC2155]